MKVRRRAKLRLERAMPGILRAMFARRIDEMLQRHIVDLLDGTRPMTDAMHDDVIKLLIEETVGRPLSNRITNPRCYPHFWREVERTQRS